MQYKIPLGLNEFFPEFAGKIFNSAEKPSFRCVPYSVQYTSLLGSWLYKMKKESTPEKSSKNRLRIPSQLLSRLFRKFMIGITHVDVSFLLTFINCLVC
jgi:hypothetical protein